MRQFEPTYSRRSALKAAGLLWALNHGPVLALTGGETVGALVEEATRTPRALRDGAEPYVEAIASKGHLADNSHEYCTETAARSARLLTRARGLRAHATVPEEAETLELLIWDLERDVALAPYYWHEFPLGYASSQIGFLVRGFLAAPLPGERPEYLSRVRQLPAFVNHVRLRLLGQKARGLAAPRVEAVRALAQLRVERQELTDLLVRAANGAAGDASGEVFGREVLQIARGPLAASFDALVESLERAYIPGLGEHSALARSESAPAYHLELARLRLSDGIDLARAHEAALASLATADADLARMRRGLGGPVDAAAFHRALSRGPRCLASDADEVAARLDRAIAAIDPLVPRYFEHLPTTPHRIAPLPEALSTRLLNGFYLPPSEADPRGTYFYNSSRLDITCWLWAVPLIAHELFPGHHLQFATQFESRTMPKYRKATAIAGYSEGWGEYARTLMEESGLYRDDPWGLYASRLFERRFALRSVVETGVHRPGWSWRQADADLASDPLTRPGTSRQIALAAATFRGSGAAYWWGLLRFRQLRRRAEAREGRSFDIRAFHATIMRGDSVPFRLLERRLGLDGRT